MVEAVGIVCSDPSRSIQRDIMVVTNSIGWLGSTSTLTIRSRRSYFCLVKKSFHKDNRIEVIMPSALFQSTSPYKPSILTISFAEDPAGSLGAQLNNRDNVSQTVLKKRIYNIATRILA